jgi:hypothetical protein
MRPPRAGDAFTLGEGAGLGDGAALGIGDAVGEAFDLSDSCAIAPETNAKPIRIAALTFFVIAAALSESRIISATVRDRRYSNSANLRSGKDCRAIRSRAEIFRRHRSPQTDRAID